MSAVATAKPDLSRAAGAILALCYLAALCEGFDVQIAGVSAAGIGHEFHPGPGALGWFFSAANVGLLVGALIGGRLSDRIGRKPVMIIGSLFGIGVPMAALYWGGSVWALAALLFVGWLASGVFPIFMATIPSETISARYVATAAGLTQGLGEAVGGFLAPWGAGKASDLYGLPAAMWIMDAYALVGGLLSLFLKETAPAQLGATPAALAEAAGP